MEILKNYGGAGSRHRGARRITPQVQALKPNLCRAHVSWIGRISNELLSGLVRIRLRFLCRGNSFFSKSNAFLFKIIEV